MVVNVTCVFIMVSDFLKSEFLYESVAQKWETIMPTKLSHENSETDRTEPWVL